MTKIGIVGSRTFKDYQLLKKELVEFGVLNFATHIVSGGAPGADSLAEDFADEYNMEKVIIRPDWDKHGKSAGIRRNTDIVEQSDIIFIFWNGKSKGTKDTLTKAKMSGKLYKLIEFNEE